MSLGEQAEIYFSLIKQFPNTKANRGKALWIDCPKCSARIRCVRSPRNGHLRACCETKGCFSCIE